MRKYKFQKDYTHYKKGDNITTDKPNKLLKKLIEKGIVK